MSYVLCQIAHLAPQELTVQQRLSYHTFPMLQLSGGFAISFVNLVCSAFKTTLFCSRSYKFSCNQKTVTVLCVYVAHS